MEESRRGDGRYIARKLKANVLSSGVTSVHMNAQETVALTEKQQEKVQVCENKLVRRIVGAKRADNRRMDALRVEVGVKGRYKQKLVRSGLIWAVHLERMEDEKR